MIFQNEKTPLQTIKTRSRKSRNIDIFEKGLTHGFGPKMAIFPTVFFREYTPRKRVLRHSRTKRTPFLAIKTRRPKRRKIDLFPKGLTHGFGPKMAIFATAFFRQYTPGKCLFSYSRTKKRLSRLLKQEVRKVQKLTFFQRV